MTNPLFALIIPLTLILSPITTSPPLTIICPKDAIPVTVRVSALTPVIVVTPVDFMSVKLPEVAVTFVELVSVAFTVVALTVVISPVAIVNVLPLNTSVPFTL